MASHFARWTLVQSKPRVHRLPQALIEQIACADEKRRTRFLAARTLLAELMLRIYGISKLPQLTVNPRGRPAFADPELPDFSIAYAGNTVGVLLAEEGSRAGLDMEIVRAHSQQTLEHYFQCLSSAEIAWVRAQSDEIEACTQLWTLRHSILKLTGERDINAPSLRLHPASGRLRSACVPDIQAICDADAVMVWSCALSPGSERLRLWEYDEREGWASQQDINVLAQNMGPRMLRLVSLPAERAPYPA